jgi:hypothetical protein
MLVVHQPWHGQFCIPNENFIHEFNKLHYSHGCPYKLKTTVQREIFRLTSGSKYREPTSQAIGINYSDFTLHDHDESNEEVVALVETLPSESIMVDDEWHFD